MSCASGSDVFCQENPERGGGSHTGSQRGQTSELPSRSSSLAVTLM